VPDIVLTTLNARYAHASFGLRYLLANLRELSDRAQMLEFEIKQPIDKIVAKILEANPKIVGIGVYIWNVAPATELVRSLKQLRPDVTVILGGPEVSYETDVQPIIDLADYVVTGEADLAFAAVCRKVLAREHLSAKVIAAELPEFAAGGSAKRLALASDSINRIELPYDLYNETDIVNRVVYVEASRGCPFKCEFCLSSLDVPVRNVPLDDFLPAMQRLLDRGLRQFKFVDRTFNLNLNISRRILEFFLDWMERDESLASSSPLPPGESRVRSNDEKPSLSHELKGEPARISPLPQPSPGGRGSGRVGKSASRDLFLHFEMIPDRLPDALRELIRAHQPPSGRGQNRRQPPLAARPNRRTRARGFDRRIARRRRHKLRPRVRPALRAAATGNSGWHAQAAARHAHRAA
jgi:hypothetical protein